MSLPVECKWTDLNRNPFGLEGVVVYDPPGDGNCLLRAISEQLLLAGIDYTTQYLRAIAAEHLEKLDQATFDNTMVTYRIDKKDAIEHAKRTGTEVSSMFANWDPDATTTIEQLAKAIMRPVYSGNGFDFQGDNIILAFLQKGLNIDFIVFDTSNPTSATRICGDKKSPFTTFLIFQKSRSGAHHYQALGISFDSDDGQNANYQALFPSNNLPKQFADHLARIDLADEDRKKLHAKENAKAIETKVAISNSKPVVAAATISAVSTVSTESDSASAKIARQHREFLQEQQQRQLKREEEMRQQQRKQEQKLLEEHKHRQENEYQHQLQLQQMQRRLQQEYAQREIDRQRAIRTAQASQAAQANQTIQATQLRQMQLEQARAYEIEQRRQYAQAQAQDQQSAYFSVNELGSRISGSNMNASALSYLQQMGLNNRNAPSVATDSGVDKEQESKRLQEQWDKDNRDYRERQLQMDQARAEHSAMMGQRQAEEYHQAEIARAEYHQRMTKECPTSEYHTKVAEAYRLKGFSK